MLQLGCPSAGIFDHRMLRMGDITLVSGCRIQVIAMAGRFAQAVRQAPAGTQVHLIHGEQDAVVLPQWSVQAHQQIGALGGTVTLDLLPGLGHGIDDRALQLAIRHLA